MDDELFMRKAIALSKAAAEHGNEPFGAVLVKDGEIVFTNENQVHTRHDPTFHGEAGLIREFCGATGITDLRDYTLYSSCEPCFMCSGAMVWVKLGRLVYGASNRDLEHIFDEEGCDCSHIVFEHSGWQPKVTSGVLREDCLAVLDDYFRPLVEQKSWFSNKKPSMAGNPGHGRFFIFPALPIGPAAGPPASAPGSPQSVSPPAWHSPPPESGAQCGP